MLNVPPEDSIRVRAHHSVEDWSMVDFADSIGKSWPMRQPEYGATWAVGAALHRCLQLGDGLHLVTMWTVTAQGTDFSSPKWSCHLWFPLQNSSNNRTRDKQTLCIPHHGGEWGPSSPRTTWLSFHHEHTFSQMSYSFKKKCQRECKTA